MEAARPHRGLIGGSLLLFPLVAVVELAQPWLLKGAIDRHILKSDWGGLTRDARLYVGVLAAVPPLPPPPGHFTSLTSPRVIPALPQALLHPLPGPGGALF